MATRSIQSNGLEFVRGGEIDRFAARAPIEIDDHAPQPYAATAQALRLFMRTLEIAPTTRFPRETDMDTQTVQRNCTGIGDVERPLSPGTARDAFRLKGAKVCNWVFGVKAFAEVVAVSILFVETRKDC